MASEVTQRQRAEAVVDTVQAELPPIWLGGRQRMILVDEIAKALTTTRQEALMEAVSKIRSRGDEYMRDCKAKDASGKKYRDTYEMRRVNSGRAWAFKDLADELDLLAREGVKG